MEKKAITSARILNSGVGRLGVIDGLNITIVNLTNGMILKIHKILRKNFFPKKNMITFIILMKMHQIMLLILGILNGLFHLE
jgi:hypothetical protein